MITLAERLTNGGFEDDGLIDALSEDAIFSCTTCPACMEACPACINQPKTILKFRQNLVMEKARVPELMGKALNSLEQRAHPFLAPDQDPKRGVRIWMCQYLFPRKPMMTVGKEEGVIGALAAIGVKHQLCAVNEIAVDEAHKIVTTPAYMLGPGIKDVAVGIEKLVKKVLSMT